MHPDTRFIFGIPVDGFSSYDDAAIYIRDRIISGRRTVCLSVNPEKIQHAKRNPKVARILRSAHVRLCDGVGLSLASRILERRPLRRCTGVDLFFRLLQTASAQGWGVFLLGASPESNEASRRAMVKTFPGLNVAGSHHGYFTDSRPVIEDINRSGAEMLFVAMGSPRQEFWLDEHLSQLDPLFLMGIGGTLDVISGRVRRAPALFQKTGTEWLFRLLADPRRARRQLALPVFAFEVFKAALIAGKGAAHSSMPGANCDD